VTRKGYCTTNPGLLLPYVCFYVQAGGEGVMTKKHAATLSKGSPGVLHGSLSYLLQDDEGQIIDPHSISAGCVIMTALAALNLCSGAMLGNLVAQIS